MPLEHRSNETSIPTVSTQRLSNPFSSSASSPTSLTPSPLIDSKTPTPTPDQPPWSTPYPPPQVSMPRRASSIDSNQLPTSPSKALRYSYQSSHHSSRPISGLPPLPPSISDPEKRAAIPTQPSYSCDDDYWPNEYYHEDVDEIKAKCLRLLVYLSAPVFITSVVLALWTLIALFLSLLLQPVNLLRKSITLREQAIYFLAPPLKIHLSFIFASVREETYASYSLPLLIIVHLLAPLVSIAVAISAWTAACFWFFATIIGDPEGTEQESRRSSYLKEQNEDGKASVLGVRNWWKRWLIRALR